MAKRSKPKAKKRSTKAAPKAPTMRVWVTEFATTRPEAAAPVVNLSGIVSHPAIDLADGQLHTTQDFSPSTKIIRIVAEVDCAFSTDGVNGIPLLARTEAYFGAEGVKGLTFIADTPGAAPA